MTHRHTYIFVAAAVASVLCAAPARALIIASSATDICAPAANPCVITDTVQIVSGSILDFGLRSVQVSAGGELDLAGGFATLRCGAFSVTTGTTIGIRLRSNTGVGGSATIEARGACSGNALLPCLTDVDCSAAAAGTCTLGSGTISIGGKVLGDAQTPATLTLLAAGDVTTTEHINMNGTVNLAGGGELTINSSRGNVTIDGNINAQGGGFDSGGIIDIAAAGNLAVRGAVDMRGGELDGGIVDVTVGGNITIENDILLDSKSGEGFGGDLLLTAGGDISIAGGAALNPLLLRNNGSTGIDGFGGDGGEHSFLAGGTISIGQFVKVLTNGAIPDGGGGDVSVSAPTISIAGIVQSKSKGGLGTGGVVDLIAGTGGLTITSTGSVDITGGNGGGGDATLLSDGDIMVSGQIDGNGANGGGAGSVFLSADAAVTINGIITTNGALSFGDTIAISGCNVTVGAGGSVDNKATAGNTLVSASGFLTIATGATVSANAISGTNKFFYGNAAFPPSIDGTVTPAPVSAFNAALPDCASCSSAAQCDDANPCTLDSCDAAAGCVNVASAGQCDDANPCTDDSCDPVSGCIFSANTLPCDDGDLCTSVDVCAAGQCTGQSPIDCSDGNPCTTDACGPIGGCFSILDGQQCNDGNSCTDDSCDPVSGCANMPNTLSCDDGNACTTGDVCSAGVCSGPAPVDCGDGNPCTDDSCSPATGCAHLANTLSCEDGNPCTIGDVCSAGVCTGPAPLDCSDGNPCTNDSCSPTQGCVHLANTLGCDDGDPCTTGDVCSAGVCTGPAPLDCSDGNPCTDDSCSPATGCVHPANSAVCDDGDPCTSGDVCSAGQCVGQTPVSCDDGNPCTDDSCQSDGSCAHSAKPGPCDDGLTCTTNDSCIAGLCVGQPPALCDDGDPCTFDTCDDGSGCLNLAAPQPTCLVAPRTMLLISDSNKDTKDKLKWKAAKGTGFGVEDLGSPVSNTPYTLCIYDSSATGASIASRIDVAPGPSWTQLGQKGWRYKDKSAISSGVQKILLRTGVTGKTKLLLTAKGANLPLPPPISASSFFAQNPAVSVQLTNGQGTCWLVHYFDAEKNLVGAFKARAR